MESKVQVSIASNVKENAENIIEEVGLTPTTVINGLYRQIIATGGIPFSFSLTPKQIVALRLKETPKNTNTKVHEITSEKEFEKLFDDD